MTNALTFTNDGAITVSAGTLYIEPNSFTDASGGSITVDNSATASIGSSGANTAWSNAGTVTIDSGGTLYLWGTFTTASLAGFTDSDGTVYLDGTLTNTGATLAVGSGGTFAPLTFASHGTIVGGTITDAGSGMVFSGGTLQGPITYEGTMNLTPSGSSVFVTGNTTTAEASISRWKPPSAPRPVPLISARTVTSIWRTARPSTTQRLRSAAPPLMWRATTRPAPPRC